MPKAAEIEALISEAVRALVAKREFAADGVSYAAPQTVAIMLGNAQRHIERALDCLTEC